MTASSASIDDDLTVPHDDGAEDGLLASILIDNSLASTAETLVKPEAFYGKGNAAIFGTLLQLAHDGSALDIVTVASALEEAGKLDLVGGRARLADLMSAAVKSANIESYARIIREKESRRRLLKLGGTIAKAATTGSLNGRLGNHVDGWREELSKIGGDDQATSEWEWSRVSFLDLVNAEIQPIPWLIEGIVARDEVSVLSAQPKEGKTYVTQGLAIDACLGRPGLGLFGVCGPLKVLWCDEEMGRGKLQRRFQRLCAGLELDDEQLQQIDQHLDIRPQQGLSLGDQAHLDAFNRAIEQTEPDLIVIDSLVALQQGEENSATDRRRFYNGVLAPIKARYGCGILVTAHPPLPSKDAAADSQKRPRGSGDIIAQVDRCLWLHKTSEEKSPDQFTVTSILEPFRSREGGDIEPVVVTLDGLEDQPVTVHAEYAGSVKGQEQIGKVYACQLEVLRTLRQQPIGSQDRREMYQPDLREHLNPHYA